MIRTLGLKWLTYRLIISYLIWWEELRRVKRYNHHVFRTFRLNSSKATKNKVPRILVFSFKFFHVVGPSFSCVLPDFYSLVLRSRTVHLFYPSQDSMLWVSWSLIVYTLHLIFFSLCFYMLYYGHIFQNFSFFQETVIRRPLTSHR